MHGVLNVVKRVMIILMCAVLLGRPLNTLQLMGIVVANAAAAAYAMLEAAGPPQPGSVSLTQVLTLPAASGAARITSTAADDRGKVGKGSRGSWFGGVPSSPSTTLSRLVTVVGATLAISALFVAYVIACLHSSVTVQQQQRQQELQLTQQHQLQPEQQIQLRLLPEGQWESTAAASWPGLTAGVAGPLMAANVSMPGVPDYVERFLVRDMGRVHCLRALHEASKVSKPCLNTAFA